MIHRENETLAYVIHHIVTDKSTQGIVATGRTASFIVALIIRMCK